jgi:hypothetical protein
MFTIKKKGTHMKSFFKKINLTALVLLMTMLFSASASLAAVDKVRCILWQGDTAKQHTAISLTSIRLKGVITTTDTTTIWYKWVYGDGTESGVTSLSGATKYNVEANYTYNEDIGTPITARLVVSDVDITLATNVQDTYLLKIEDNTLDARVNIAIDNGLWYLYKSGSTSSSFHTMDGSSYLYWGYSSYYAAPTASAVQAFGINEHKVNGDFNEDPYAEAVSLGMNWLIQGYSYSTSYPMLRAVGISVQTAGHPESGQASPNSLGIEVRDYGYRPIYEGGQVMDAIIASGVLPGDSTGRDFQKTDGDVTTNWTYGEVLQDMCDMYSYGQYDDSRYGGWRYSWNQFPDNSACQWAAIGMIPAQKAPWNCIVPDWVKTYNDGWLNYSHSSWYSGGVNWGGFGYTSAGWGDALTPSGMVQLPFAGNDTSDPRWVRTERWFADNWKDVNRDWLDRHNLYGYYAFAKAMRVALPSPVEKFSSNDFNWYRGSATTMGLAEKLVTLQNTTSGYWNQSYGGYLSTAWAIVILRPALFKASPIACFDANPTPTYPNEAITFDPACSNHSQTGKDITNLVLFEWDWDNDGTYDESTTDPVAVTHQFGCASLPCVYPVTLRVTDDDPDEALSATYSFNIEISNPPHPPVANAGGPYMVSLCEGDTLTLVGSASFDPNEGEHEAGCTTCPDDTITAWNWDWTDPLTGYDDASGETVTLDSADIALAFGGGGVFNVALRVTDNTLLAYPNSDDPNLAHSGFHETKIYASCGSCELTARARTRDIQLTWTPAPGVVSYDIYRSTEGVNAGFVKIATGYETDYAVFLDTNVVAGTTYYYRVVWDNTCGTKAVSATPVVRVRR